VLSGQQQGTDTACGAEYLSALTSSLCYMHGVCVFYSAGCANAPPSPGPHAACCSWLVELQGHSLPQMLPLKTFMLHIVSSAVQEVLHATKLIVRSTLNSTCHCSLSGHASHLAAATCLCCVVQGKPVLCWLLEFNCARMLTTQPARG
jgi:hypothetical protein